LSTFGHVHEGGIRALFKVSGYLNNVTGDEPFILPNNQRIE